MILILIVTVTVVAVAAQSIYSYQSPRVVTTVVFGEVKWQMERVVIVRLTLKLILLRFVVNWSWSVVCDEVKSGEWQCEPHE